MHVSLWMRRAHDKSENDPSKFQRKYPDPIQKSSTSYDSQSAEHVNQIFDGVSHQVRLGSDVGVPRYLLGDMNSSNSMEQQNSGERILNQHVVPDDYLLELSELPSFSSNGGDFFLSSIIERSSSSAELYLTTFLLCHHALEPPVAKLADLSKVVNVDPGMKDSWRRAFAKFKTTRYYQSGAREQSIPDEIYYCEIKHSRESKPYTVLGQFLPNRLTPDVSANRLLDVLRCPVRDPQSAYTDYASGNGSVSINILRGKDYLMRFMIPWKSRRAGYLASSSKAASHLDSWKGHHLTIEKKNTNTTTTTKPSTADKLHVCIPSIKQAAGRYELSMVLEHVSHHLLIGASHIYLPVPFPWNSPMMNRYTEIFQSYIQEGNINDYSR